MDVETSTARAALSSAVLRSSSVQFMWSPSRDVNKALPRHFAAYPRRRIFPPSGRYAASIGLETPARCDDRDTNAGSLIGLAMGTRVIIAMRSRHLHFPRPPLDSALPRRCRFIPCFPAAQCRVLPGRRSTKGRVAPTSGGHGRGRFIMRTFRSCPKSPQPQRRDKLIVDRLG